MSTLPRGLEQAFTVAAGELGMCSAAWLYVQNVAGSGGEAAVSALRDALGRSFPVLDAVCERWLSGTQTLEVDATSVAQTLRGVTDVVVVGVEAYFLDALVAKLAGVRCALLRHAPLEADWDRILSNYGGRVTLVDLESFQAFAGPSSALLTFAYGVHGASTHVLPAWLRVTGEDVRTQFRSLVAWDVLEAPMFVYPRWLIEVSAANFTEVV